MMERLTKRQSDGSVIAWHTLEYYNYNDFKKVLDRLAYYEDMEEQGRLVVLPCKAGDSFFVIADICLCPPNENGCDECDKCSECRYAVHEVREREFKSVLQIINIEKNFGKTVFLTREQAEEALKGGAN